MPFFLAGQAHAIARQEPALLEPVGDHGEGDARVDFLEVYDPDIERSVLGGHGAWSLLYRGRRFHRSGRWLGGRRGLGGLHQKHKLVRSALHLDLEAGDPRLE
jgi:hypothetical protein